MDVTKETIKVAYRLFLDREASETEVNVMASSEISFEQLRNAFLNSREFNNKNSARNLKTNHSMRPARALVHLHIPKTAGSSLTRILAPHVASGTQLPVSDGDLATFAALSETKRRKASFIYGHLSHGIAHLLPQGHNYICVLRKPAARLLSYYKYLYRTTDHHSQKFVGGQDMSFGTFLEWTADPANGHINEVNNGQIRRLAGLKMQRDGASDPQLLLTAVRNIASPDMVFGLTEHFNHFVHRLSVRGLIVGTPDVWENMAPSPSNLENALSALTPDQTLLYNAFTAWDEVFYNVAEQLYFAQDPPPTKTQ